MERDEVKRDSKIFLVRLRGWLIMPQVSCETGSEHGLGAGDELHFGHSKLEVPGGLPGADVRGPIQGRGMLRAKECTKGELWDRLMPEVSRGREVKV